MKSGHLPRDFLSCKVQQVVQTWAGTKTGHTPLEEEVAMAASLAASGHLKQVECVKLKNFDISRKSNTFTKSTVTHLYLKMVQSCNEHTAYYLGNIQV